MAALENPKYLSARNIAHTLRSAGHQAYLAGGCVRDLLLGVAPKDYDVATSATPDAVLSLFPEKKAMTVGAHFGVVLVCEPDGTATEVATFRNDGVYTDGRRPDSVRFSTDAREDVRRRDFTINGMLLDPEIYERTGDAAQATLDLVGGREDLDAKVVRAIGDPHLRFTEDKLRMLRGVRFAARLGFAIDPATATAIHQLDGQITVVSPERIRDELTLILTEGNARLGFELLDQLGLLPHILPEITKLHGVQQPPEYHPEGDVWIHTLMLLEKLPSGASSTLAWGALLHDVGKPATYRAPDRNDPTDRIRFNGHVEVGVRISEEILSRLHFSNEDIAQITALVKNHMRFGDVRHMREATLKRFLRLHRFDEHLALHRIDCLSSHGDLSLYEFAKERFETTPQEAIQPKPLLTGRELIAAGYSPGPRFKKMLEAAEDAQLEGTVHTAAEALRLVQDRFGSPAK
ncbi:MAG TPA: CCA tRNA nucleotidyltransferase [Edaphobacter sp.]|nr:CCA tRNA nucleotidyltransferase [Edaphobacter sp.]